MRSFNRAICLVQKSTVSKTKLELAARTLRTPRTLRTWRIPPMPMTSVSDCIRVCCSCTLVSDEGIPSLDAQDDAPPKHERRNGGVATRFSRERGSELAPYNAT